MNLMMKIQAVFCLPLNASTQFHLSCIMYCHVLCLFVFFVCHVVYFDIVRDVPHEI